MKTIEELRAYYETDLLPTLKILDRDRKKSIVFAHTRNTSLDHCSHYCPLFFFGPVGLDGDFFSCLDWCNHLPCYIDR